MKLYATLLAATLMAASAFTMTMPPAHAAAAVTAKASADTSDELEYKAYAAQMVAVDARKAANAARAKSNKVVGTKTTTKLQRTQAELAAIRAENYAAWAEAAYDQAEVNAATVDVKNTQNAELRARQAANSAATAAAKARASANQAHAAAAALSLKAPGQKTTKAAQAKADAQEQTALRLEYNRAVTGQYQALMQEHFTKAKARVIAGRAIVAHRGIKGHLSLPLSMPLSKPILRGEAKVGPLKVGPLVVGTPTP